MAVNQIMGLDAGGNTMNQDATESLLIRKAAAGSKAAFDLLLIKHQSQVYRVVRGVVKDEHEAEDITQEVFIRAWRAIGSFRGDSQFSTWLHRIAINTSRNFLQSRLRRVAASDIDVSEAETYEGGTFLRDPDTPEALIRRDELEQVIQDTLAGLSEDMRTALTLREMDGMSYEEIAEVMQCPVGTIRSRIHRAREEMQVAIGRWQEGES
jgi:RNA polymerase sigma-70 factor (ECF subfamily)